MKLFLYVLDEEDLSDGVPLELEQTHITQLSEGHGKVCTCVLH